MLLFYQWTVTKTSEWIGGEKGALRWPYTPSGTVVFFILWFWVLCFKWIKKKALYTQDIWREKWKTSVLMGLRSIPVRKKRKVQQALDFVSINLLFRGKNKCFGRQLLWPFSVLGFVYQTLKALSLWQQEPSRQKGEEVWESREVSLSILCSFCWSSFVEWPLCDLHSNWNLAILEYVFSVLLQRQI